MGTRGHLSPLSLFPDGEEEPLFIDETFIAPRLQLSKAWDGGRGLLLSRSPNCRVNLYWMVW